ncbi:MAG: SDR family NAD(P)-dependent oxidoreductase, partial [Promethearchaeota archaeon]
MIDPSKRLLGKNTLVTGAGSGIGKAIAIRFAKEGANVAINDLKEDAAIETANLIEDLGVKTKVLVADVTNNQQVQEMVKQYYATFNRLDVLVNNAGVGGSMSRVVSMKEETWDRILNANLKSVFLVSKYFAKKMMKQDINDGILRGKIINIASTRARGGRAMFAAYGASKAGVLNLTQTLALELGKSRITVNAICPGLIHTPIWGKISAEQLAGTNPQPITLAKVKPVGKPED